MSHDDDSESNNSKGSECPYESSSSDDGVRSNSEQRAMSMSPYPQQESKAGTTYSNEISFLDHFQEGPDAFMDMHENDSVPTGVWREPTDFLNDNFYLASKMLFKSKKDLQRAVKLYHIKEGKDFFVVKSGKEVIRVFCKRADQGCSFNLCATKDSSNNLWKIGKYIGEHTCNMGDCHGGHFNLDINMIANVLVPYIEKTPRYYFFPCSFDYTN